MSTRKVEKWKPSEAAMTKQKLVTTWQPTQALLAAFPIPWKGLEFQQYTIQQIWKREKHMAN